MSIIRLIRLYTWRTFQFVGFYLSAKNRYRIHHQKIYEFCLSVLDDSRPFYLYGDVKSWREFLVQSRNRISIADYGAGSLSYKTTSDKTVRQVYQKCSSPVFKGKWLARLVWWWQAESILELGTCLGVGSAYLAGASKESSFIGVEGSKILSEYTEKALQHVKAPKAQVLNEKFEDILPDLLKEKQFDLVFVDGNHTKTATLQYDSMLRKQTKNRCLIIYDDIYWNPDMNAAWQKIKQHPDNQLCIDLYFIGLIVINSQLNLIPNQFKLLPFSWRPLPI